MSGSLSRTHQLRYVGQVIDAGIVKCVIPQPVIRMLRAFIPLADGVFPHLIPPLLVSVVSVLQAVDNVADRVSSLHAIAIVISGKVLVCVLTCHHAQGSAVVEQHIPLYLAYSTSTQIHITADSFGLESSVNDIFHRLTP